MTQQTGRRRSPLPTTTGVVLVLALLLAGTFVGRAEGARAQSEPGWKRIAAGGAGPGPRWDHTLAADDEGKGLIVFGGRDDNGVSLGDTWIFDREDQTWTQVTGAAPEPRFGHAVAVDQEARVLYLFGGQTDATFFNDVWRFDFAERTWSRLDPAGGEAPAPRYGTSAVFDGDGRLIISHGFTFEGRFDDTWAFDVEERSWTDLSPADGVRPLKRCLHEAVWDDEAGRMLLFGGCSSGFGPCPQGDLWSFDPETRSWTELTPASGPAARSNPALAFDRARDRAVLVGGLTAEGYAADLWLGTADDGAFVWTSLTVEGDGPSPRASLDAVMTGGALYLFGGTSSEGTFDDLWRLKLPRG